MRILYNTWGDDKCIKYFNRKPEGKNHLRDLGIDGRIILKWILEE
jgi:hypothetical protein